jgi:hypothetical protein
MNEENRQGVADRNRRRAYNCDRCGSSGLQEVDGSACGGMPGIRYKYCGGCGNAKPIVKRQSKRDGLELLR